MSWTTPPGAITIGDIRAAANAVAARGYAQQQTIQFTLSDIGAANLRIAFNAAPPTQPTPEKPVIHHPDIVSNQTTTLQGPERHEGLLTGRRHFVFTYDHGYARLGLGATDNEAWIDYALRTNQEWAIGAHHERCFPTPEERDNVFKGMLAAHQPAAPDLDFTRFAPAAPHGWTDENILATFSRTGHTTTTVVPPTYTTTRQSHIPGHTHCSCTFCTARRNLSAGLELTRHRIDDTIPNRHSTSGWTT